MLQFLQHCQKFQSKKHNLNCKIDSNFKFEPHSTPPTRCYPNNSKDNFTAWLHRFAILANSEWNVHRRRHSICKSKWSRIFSPSCIASRGLIPPRPLQFNRSTMEPNLHTSKHLHPRWKRENKGMIKLNFKLYSIRNWIGSNPVRLDRRVLSPVPDRRGSYGCSAVKWTMAWRNEGKNCEKITFKAKIIIK